MTLRAAVVVPVSVRHDAISESARSTLRMLHAEPGWTATLLTAAQEDPTAGTRIVDGPAELLLDPAFRQADVLIYHFGIYHSLFDTLPFGNARARRIVRFHNITPAALVAPCSRGVIARSFRQLPLLNCADAVWADSGENASVLAKLGIGEGRVEVLPLAVDWPASGLLVAKPRNVIEALYVGRIVPSKGLRDLLEHWPLKASLRLTVVGNAVYSDHDYVALCLAIIADRGLESTVRILGTVSEQRLSRLYRESHILALPSYHEGFCKPVIEALRAGCVPVGYAAAAIPDTCGGLGRLVSPGDANALSAVLQTVACAMQAGRTLELDAGTMTIPAFDRAAQARAALFTTKRLGPETVARIRALI